MKVISILQPWASLVVLGLKKIETRSWNTKYRGEILIHASLGKNFKKLHHTDPLHTFYYPLFANSKIERIEKLPFGAIIGKVNLVDTIPTNDLIDGGIDRVIHLNIHPEVDSAFEYNLTPQELAFGDYSAGRFGWLLSEPVAFHVPIPAKGQLGLWEYDIESRIKAAEELERDGYL